MSQTLKVRQSACGVHRVNYGHVIGGGALVERVRRAFRGKHYVFTDDGNRFNCTRQEQADLG